MQLHLKDNLPFLPLTLTYHGKSIEISNILLDTGSASTLISADLVSLINLVPSASDVLHTIRGVGGVEVVFLRGVDTIQVGKRVLENFEIEVGGIDYGFEIESILGMDFLMKAGAVIDLNAMQISFIDELEN